MLTQKVCWLSRVFYMPLWNRSGIISSVEGIWLDVTLTRSLFISLVCYYEKDNLCSLLDSGRQIFHWSKLTMLSPWVQPWVRGRSAGSFPEQRLVIEPRFLAAANKIRMRSRNAITSFPTKSFRFLQKNKRVFVFVGGLRFRKGSSFS